ncbi:hypothetical protein FKM82_023397 [Ascaphus truei]
MLLGNVSLVMEFILLGFPGTPPLKHIFFLLLLITYLITLLSNIMIMIIIWRVECLHTPMYYYLRTLSFLEVCNVSVTVPKILATITSQGRLISFASCFTQLFFFFFLSSTECFLLAVMAFDRYLAICYPLRYPALMNSYICLRLTMCAWLGGFITTFPPILLISQLPLCKNTYLNDILNFICASLVILTSFLVILISYLYIIATIIKIPTIKGRRKAFSTCGSHLIVVLIYYGTVIFMYVRPSAGFTFSLNRIVSVFYTVITSILNPIIYCLRNKEVKEALGKTFSYQSTSEKRKMIF